MSFFHIRYNARTLNSVSFSISYILLCTREVVYPAKPVRASCTMEKLYSLVPQGGLVCEECPLGLNAFLSTRPPKGLKNIRYESIGA